MDAAHLSLLWTIPFVGMLLSIGLFPLLAPHWWHHHFHQWSIGMAVLFAAPFLLVYGQPAWVEIVHIFLVDYVPFVILLWALFTISGGILVRGTLPGTPIINCCQIIAGTLLASWIGTTGASMLLIRPLLRANAGRRYKVHTVVFFIFLVSNVGGCLTPLGDPPLFLGFLHHVPFFWTLTHLWPAMLITGGILTAVYFLLDSIFYRYEREDLPAYFAMPKEALQLVGKVNFLLLAGVVGAVLMSGTWKPTDINWGEHVRDGELIVLPAADHHAESHTAHYFDPAAEVENHAEKVVVEPGDETGEGHEHGHGVSIPLQNVARDGLLILLGLLSLALTPKGVRAENEFSWFPIKEVAWLFAGIFMTIIPALLILKAGTEGALAGLIATVKEPIHYFWVTGALSSFLDNAPTYLTFFNTALGNFFPGVPESEAVPMLIAQQNDYLVAISLGAVFMGANTYIGNAPNFMVRSIAEEADVKMPDFFSYIFRYSLPILIPTFVLVGWLLL